MRVGPAKGHTRGQGRPILNAKLDPHFTDEKIQICAHNNKKL